ncbi:pilus assembly protein PilV [Geobacter hydrogenophilus]|nr:pilus assembly protein PilV [Geobacter hydrogenophilus]
MAVGLLGMLQAVNVATEYNLRNQLRDEAVRVGENTMHEIRRLSFDNITGSSPITVTRSMRGFSKQFVVERNYSPPLGTTSDWRQIILSVRWDYRNASYVHRVITVKSR